MEIRKVIKVPEDELGIKRAYRDAVEAKGRGEKLAFDLRYIKDRKTKVDIITHMSRRP